MADGGIRGGPRCRTLSELSERVLTTNAQHQLGNLVGKDAQPEFFARILPPGSTLTGRKFKPNINAAKEPQNMDTESERRRSAASNVG